MLINSEIREIYKDIQNDLFQMIPEKWDKICLYAAIIDEFDDTSQNEMFFYYFPSGILKKNPVNVYEIPAKFNIDEAKYSILVDILYSHIKKLKQENIKKKQWTNITIIIHNFKFYIEYNYSDLNNNQYTSYERHIIWRYTYLGIGFEKCTRKEREIIRRYLTENPYYINSKIEHHEETMYKNPKENLIHYDKQIYLKEEDTNQETNYFEFDEELEKEYNNIEEKKLKQQKNEIETNEQSNVISQILALKD